VSFLVYAFLDEISGLSQMVLSSLFNIICYFFRIKIYVMIEQIQNSLIEENT